MNKNYKNMKILENTSKHVKLMIEYIFVQIKDVSISYEPKK